MFDEISGNLEFFGDRENCMLNASFMDSDPAAVTRRADLAGSCAKQGGAFKGVLAVNGQHFPVTLQLRLTGQDGHFDTVILGGPVSAGGARFDARIALGSAAP